METLFEILKYTIPGLLVFATAYFILQQQIDEQNAKQAAQRRREGLKITLPLRLQAYERLILLCERATVPNTLLRVRVPGMNTGTLKGVMLLSLNQEFDHNTSQQLYVSDTLWQILRLAREETVSLITGAAEGLDPESPDDEYVERLFKALEKVGEPGPMQRAAVAVRTEAGAYF